MAPNVKGAACQKCFGTIYEKATFLTAYSYAYLLRSLTHYSRIDSQQN